MNTPIDQERIGQRIEQTRPVLVRIFRFRKTEKE